MIGSPYFFPLLYIKGGILLNWIVLFDGDCSVCNRSVNFIIKRDPKGRFSFASLQSEVGRSLKQTYNIPKEINSIVLIGHKTYSTKSTAVLNICKQLAFPWKLLNFFILIPKPIRDFFYTLFAKHRYRFLPKETACSLHETANSKRFL